jgi:hypothetical protein
MKNCVLGALSYSPTMLLGPKHVQARELVHYVPPSQLAEESAYSDVLSTLKWFKAY